jgi:hypothetical protein
LPSSFFFFVSVDGEVDVVDEVSVIVVSVGGGVVDLVSVVAVSVGGFCSRGVRSFGIAGVVLPIVSVTTGAFVVRAGVRGREAGRPGAPAGYAGIDDAIEPPAVSVPSGAGFVGSVKFVVVSTFVFVSGGVVSPGALMVDVTPLAEPSSTVWYCC